MKAVVAGGSGFVGKALLAELKRQGFETVVLSRNTNPVPGADRVVRWDGKTVDSWQAELDGAQHVYNLCGPSVTARWTEKYRRQMRDGRVQPTKAIGEAIAAAKSRPSAWVNASAIGFYGDTGDRPVAESCPPGSGFLADLCQEWEQAMDEQDLPDVARSKARIGVVLGRDGGAFPLLSKVTKAFMGGALGDGRQYMPWIHVEDLAAMLVWAANERVVGPFNATGPHPVTNAEMMDAFRSVYGKPPIPPAPKQMVGLISGLLGIDQSVLLEGSRVEPVLALARGFQFKHPDLIPALEAMAGLTPTSWAS